MSDIVTGTVTGQVNDGPILREISNARRESAMYSADIRREASVNEGVTSMNVKDGVTTVKDQATAFYIAAQQTNFANSTALAALKASTDAQFTATQQAISLAQAQNAAATALASANLSSLVSSDGAATRALIQAQKIEDLRFANLKHDHGYNRGGCGCGNTKFNFGPPTGAVLSVENANNVG